MLCFVTGELISSTISFACWILGQVIYYTVQHNLYLSLRPNTYLQVILLKFCFVYTYKMYREEGSYSISVYTNHLKVCTNWQLKLSIKSVYQLLKFKNNLKKVVDNLINNKTV